MKVLGTVKFGNVEIEVISDSVRATAANLYFKPGVAAVKHHHPHEEFNYIKKGRFNCVSNGETTVVGPGDVVLVPPNTTHSLECLDEPGEVLTFWSPSRRDLIEKIK